MGKSNAEVRENIATHLCLLSFFRYAFWQMESLTYKELENALSYFVYEKEPKNLRSYSAFQRLYEDVTSPDTVIEIDPEQYTSHEHIRASAEYLKTHNDCTRKEFVGHAFPNYVPEGAARKRDPASIIVQLTYMLDCDSKDRHSRNRVIGNWQPTRWEHDQTFRDFVQETLPASATPMKPSQQDFGKLAAWRLKHQYGMQLIATNNIAEHLLYDPANGGTLRIFHQVSWLTAQAKHTQSTSNTSRKYADERSELLPQHVIEETLDTFYKILFPLSNEDRRRSIDLLNDLIKGGLFDRNAISPSTLPPEGLQYYYWGGRISDLLQVVNNPPPPANKVAKWLEGIKGERTILFIAIIGIFLSAFFGMLSVIIGALQLWIAWTTMNNSVVSDSAHP